MVEVRRVNFNASLYADEMVVRFVSSTQKTSEEKYSTALISYSFTESMSDVNGGFSLGLTLEKDSKWRTWLDKLHVMDLVFIYEFDELRFIGYIENIRYSGKIAGGKPDRKIMISGGNMGRLLSSFKLIMNKFILKFSGDAKSVSATLRGTLAMKQSENAPVAEILREIYNNFMHWTLMMAEGEGEKGSKLGNGIYQMLKKYVDYESKLSKDVRLKYGINVALYNTGENNIWEIWQNLLVPPVYEMFGRTSKEEKFELVFRQAPFDSDDWRRLTLNTIPLITISDHDLGQSIEQVYTCYVSVLEGGPYPAQMAMLLDQEEDFDFVVIDRDKWKLYGYKPMIVTHRYYDRDLLDQYADDASLMGELTRKLKQWYEYNDEFISGTVSIMTVNPNEWGGKLQNPQIGEKIGLMGGEFYVEAATHSWNYKGPMVTKLTISRGYNYINGIMISPIIEFGNKLNLYAREKYEKGTLEEIER
jgi:hypothetical protein